MRLGVTALVGEQRFFHAAWEAVEDWTKANAAPTPPVRRRS